MYQQPSGGMVHIEANLAPRPPWGNLRVGLAIARPTNAESDRSAAYDHMVQHQHHHCADYGDDQAVEV